MHRNAEQWLTEIRSGNIDTERTRSFEYSVSFFLIEIVCFLSTLDSQLQLIAVDAHPQCSKGSSREYGEKYIVMRGEIVRRSTDRSFALSFDDIALDRDRRSIDQPIATIPDHDRRNGFYQRMVRSRTCRLFAWSCVLLFLSDKCIPLLRAARVSCYVNESC